MAKSYPNIQIISRNGAQTYASASFGSHPTALQISNRFHLLKNLSEAAERYMRRLFPSRLAIPSTKGTLSPEMQALYNTRNRAERICYAKEKHLEGYTINDIALLLHSSANTISRYLTIPDNEIAETKENAREIQHVQQLEKKKMAIDEVRKLYSDGHSINEITRSTGHTTLTVRNYLSENCSANNGRYDYRIPGKLAPYEQDVIKMLTNGITYSKIHEYISQNGYTGTVASLRVFILKERTHKRTVVNQEENTEEYILENLCAS